MGDPRLTRMLIRGVAIGAVATAMLVGLAAGTNWRLALVAGLTAGAIALTRLRYSAIAALAMLAVTLGLAQTGHTAGSDDRPVPAPASGR